MSKNLNEAAMRSELSGTAFFKPTPKASAPSDMAASKPSPPSEAEQGSPEPPTLAIELTDLSKAGYTQHSYRFTEEELSWLHQFCLDVGSRIGSRVYHNTLIRVLLRLAEEEWKSNPEDNRLSRLLKAQNK